MAELPSVISVKTGIHGEWSVSWMPAYDREHDDLGFPGNCSLVNFFKPKGNSYFSSGVHPIAFRH